LNGNIAGEDLNWPFRAAAFKAGKRGGARSTDVAPAMTANASSSRSPSLTPPSAASSRAALIPVNAASRHDNTADAPATPTLVPNTRIRLSRPPASPMRSRGAALIVALLFGAMKMPSPAPNTASETITLCTLAATLSAPWTAISSPPRRPPFR